MIIKPITSITFCCVNLQKNERSTKLTIIVLDIIVHSRIALFFIIKNLKN